MQLCLCVFLGQKNPQIFTQFMLYIRTVKTNTGVHLLLSYHAAELRSKPLIYTGLGHNFIHLLLKYMNTAKLNKNKPTSSTVMCLIHHNIAYKFKHLPYTTFTIESCPVLHYNQTKLYYFSSNYTTVLVFYI